MTIEQVADEIKDEFAFLDNWNDRYTHIIDLGRSNPSLNEEHRTPQYKVRGCTSQVWLVVSDQSDGKLVIEAESDALIVSGLISVLTRLFSNQSPRNILNFDAKSFFQDIGLLGALSSVRANGLAAMVARIHYEAEQRITRQPQ